MKKKIAVYANGWGAENLCLFLRGIEDKAFSENADIYTFLSFMYFSMPRADEAGEISIYELPDMNDFDGVIVYSNGLNNPLYAEKLVKKAIAAGKPVVSLGIMFDGASYVSTNNRTGMSALADHLVKDCSVRKVVFFAGNEGNPESDERMQCMSDALAEVGEKFKTVFYTNWGTEETIQFIDRHFNSKEKLPDAFVCANDYIALAACFELNKHGINVPDDVLVTGFDGIRDGMTFFPSLATVSQDYYNQGKAAATIILEQINSGDLSPVSHLIDSKFLPGESSGDFSARDSRSDRDNACRNYYAERTEKVFLNDHLNAMESALYSCTHTSDISQVMSSFYVKDHSFEGENFWIVGEKSYATSIYNDEIPLRRRFFSDDLSVMVALEKGVSKTYQSFSKKEIVPGASQRISCHHYMLIPIHTGDVLYAYLVVENLLEKLTDFSLEVYRRATRNALDKYRQNIKLEFLNKKLSELYTRDSLTGLYNRFAYDRFAIPMYEKAKENGHACAIVFIDINRMKYINDNFGHLHGDLAIRTVASIITMHAPKSWISIRYGGDEYVIIGECESEDIAKDLVKTLSCSIKEHVAKLELPFPLTASIGYIMTDPSSSTSLDAYVQQADDIMYESKKVSHEKDGINR